MNRLKTTAEKQAEQLAAHREKQMKAYKADSISLLNAGIILLTCLILAGLIENL